MKAYTVFLANGSSVTVNAESYTVEADGSIHFMKEAKEMAQFKPNHWGGVAEGQLVPVSVAPK